MHSVAFLNLKQIMLIFFTLTCFKEFPVARKIVYALNVLVKRCWSYAKMMSQTTWQLLAPTCISSIHRPFTPL